MSATHSTEGYYEAAIPLHYPVSCALDNVKIYRADPGNYAPEKLGQLLRKSSREGFTMISRMDAQWQSGENRFSKPGEGLYFAEYGGQVVAVLARVADANDPTALELRMGYVMPDYRHLGLGGYMLQAVCDDIPQGLFQKVAVRAHFHVARSFCKKAGFYCCAGRHETKPH